MKSRKLRRGGGLFSKRPISEPRLSLNLGDRSSQMVTNDNLDALDATFDEALRIARRAEKIEAPRSISDRTINTELMRKSHVLTYNGRTMPLADWAREYGMSYTLLAKRINNLGWSPERALARKAQVVSRDDEERRLNDLPLSELPVKFQELLKSENYDGPRPGTHIREKHRAIFNEWYESTISVDQQSRFKEAKQVPA